MLRLEAFFGQFGVQAMETDAARFFGYVPNVGEHAYVHTVFKPVAREQLQSVSNRLDLPKEWQDFLAIQNGADLFISTIFIYGVDCKRPLRRSSIYREAPFSLEKRNMEPVARQEPTLLQIGGYGYNGARIFLSRLDGRVLVTTRTGEETLGTWGNVRAYLADELTRVNSMFSSSGDLLVDEKFTVPSINAMM